MIVEWNSQVACPYAFSDFRDFSSWTSAKEFTRMAFNLEKFYVDFTWDELVQTLRCVSDAKSKESEQNFALALLEKNFMAIHQTSFFGRMNGSRILICSMLT